MSAGCQSGPPTMKLYFLYSIAAALSQTAKASPISFGISSSNSTGISSSLGSQKSTQKNDCPLCIPSSKPSEDTDGWSNWLTNVATWDGDLPDSEADRLANGNLEELEDLLDGLEKNEIELMIHGGSASPEFTSPFDNSARENVQLLLNNISSVASRFLSTIAHYAKKTLFYIIKFFYSPRPSSTSPPVLISLPGGKSVSTEPICTEPVKGALQQAQKFMRRFVTHDLSSHPAASFRSDVDNGKCADTILIYGKGTGHLGNIGCGGDLGQVLAKTMDAILPGRVAVQGVNYRALLAGYFKGGSPTGVSKLLNTFFLATSACPNSKIVMAGYSQGAQLILPAIKEIVSHSSLKERLLPRIAAVLTFGDPNNGVRFPKDIEDRVFRACNPGDMVCEGWDGEHFAKLPIFAESPHRSEYYYSAIPEAAQFVLKKIEEAESLERIDRINVDEQDDGGRSLEKMDILSGNWTFPATSDVRHLSAE